MAEKLTPAPWSENPKIVAFPAKETLIEKIADHPTFRNSKEGHWFLTLFLEEIAGQELDSIGLFNAWELARYETFNGYPYIVDLAADMGFNGVIDLVCSDPEAASQAKEWRKYVREEQIQHAAQTVSSS